MKKWKCRVCGYIHMGDEPPEKCPVCGAARSMFIEIFPEEASAPRSEPVPPKPEPLPEEKPGKASYLVGYDMVTEQMARHHLHPITVHVPNGVLPASMIFVFLAVVFGLAGFEIAASYNLAFVLLAMPMVLFSGYVEWRKRYGGLMSSVFVTKMVCGGVVLCLSFFLVVWRFLVPDVALSGTRWIYLFLHLILLGAAGVAGHLGGRLVFAKDRDSVTCL